MQKDRNMKKNRNILRCKKVTVDFQGFLAVRGLDFELSDGELRFLIGPNGAGKTTFLDVICGRVRPVAGEVIFKGERDLIGMQEYKIAREGIGKKFQTPTVFPNLTVFENLEISMRQPRGIFSLLVASLSAAQRERIEEVLDLTGLDGDADLEAGSLSHGQKQWLEIGMVLIQEPQLLLLDEPVAGMTRKEKEKTGRLLEEVCGSYSVLIVEHDMDFVREFARKVTVMHEGRVLCEGSVEEVQADRRVNEVYLGREGEEGARASRN